MALRLEAVHLLSQTRSGSAMKHIAVIASRIELTIHVDMDGYVKDIRVRIESLLAPITFDCQQWPIVPKILFTMMHIPAEISDSAARTKEAKKPVPV